MSTVSDGHLPTSRRNDRKEERPTRTYLGRLGTTLSEEDLRMIDVRGLLCFLGSFYRYFVLILCGPVRSDVSPSGLPY